MATPGHWDECEWKLTIIQKNELKHILFINYLIYNKNALTHNLDDYPRIVDYFLWLKSLNIVFQYKTIYSRNIYLANIISEYLRHI